MTMTNRFTSKLGFSTRTLTSLGNRGKIMGIIVHTNKSSSLIFSNQNDHIFKDD